MPYTLLLHVLVNIQRKEKAEAHLTRLFPGMAANIDGRYWKDQSLWEANLRRNFDYPNDYVALWETLSFLRGAAANWMINSGPNDASCEVVAGGIVENDDGTGLVWCSFELLRGGVFDAPGLAPDV